jgi:hypothetical protein
LVKTATDYRVVKKAVFKKVFLPVSTQAGGPETGGGGEEETRRVPSTFLHRQILSSNPTTFPNI